MTLVAISLEIYRALFIFFFWKLATWGRLSIGMWFRFAIGKLEWQILTSEPFPLKMWGWKIIVDESTGQEVIVICGRVTSTDGRSPNVVRPPRPEAQQTRQPPPGDRMEVRRIDLAWWEGEGIGWDAKGKGRANDDCVLITWHWAPPLMESVAPSSLSHHISFSFLAHALSRGTSPSKAAMTDPSWPTFHRPLS